MKNVIVCLCDQMRPFELGCYGHEVVQTPHIDKLAEEGFRFELAVSNNPWCVPARSCVLSGQYGRTCIGRLGYTGDLVPALERERFPNPTIAEIFKKADYRTGIIGKWHIDAHPTLLGFDECVYSKMYHLNRYQEFIDNTGRAYEVGYTEDYNIDRLNNFLDNQPRERPFFLYYNIATPHMPFFDVPEHYQTMYKKEDVILRPNVFKDGEMTGDYKAGIGDATWFEIYMWDQLARKYKELMNLKLPKGFDLRSLYARYYGMVSYTDEQVGKMMAALQAHGFDENTVVVFTSDHGDLLGSHQLYNKSYLLEESIRIPMIWSFPREIKPQVNQTQVTSLIDIMPTLLSMSGIEVPPYVQGKDLSPILYGLQKVLPDNYAFIDTDVSEIGVRSPEYMIGMKTTDLDHGQDKLLLNNKRGYGLTWPVAPKIITNERYMVYDCINDPFQMENRTGCNDPEVIKLQQKLKQWHAQTPLLKE